MIRPLFTRESGKVVDSLLFRARRKLRNWAVLVWRHLYEMFSPRQVNIESLYTGAPLKENRIPNRVFQTWKSPMLPALHAWGTRRFRQMNPEYSFCFYDDLKMAQYMESRFAGHPILAVFRRIRVPAARADVWRYCVLYREGGVYCDIDSAISIPLRELLDGSSTEMISFESNRLVDLFDIDNFADPAVFLPAPPESIRSNLEFPENIILNWLLCFEKGNPILAEVIDLIVRHFPFFENRRFEDMLRAVIHCTGPIALTQAVWMWMQKTGKRPRQCGIDFNGHGIFKLPGSDKRYVASPHYASMPASGITEG